MQRKSKPREKDRRVRVLLVDECPIVRAGLRQMIARAPDLTLCGEAGTASEALKAIVELKPDLAIVDPSLGDSSGIDLITSAMTQSPSLMILVLSMRSESFHVERALRAGAKGYVTKDQGSQDVLAAIRRVLSGEVHLSRHLVSKMLARMTTDRSSARAQVIADLSNRELQVFELIGHGLSTREIAAKLHLSVKTIESHKEKIKKKLKLRDASRLYRHAVLWSEYHRASGIISPPGGKVNSQDPEQERTLRSRR